MEKFARYPKLSDSALRILSPREWKVDIVGRLRPLFAMSPITRSRISLAARFVKVIAVICRASAFFLVIRCTILFAITLVFPLPAPAKTSSGVSLCLIAASCCLFNLITRDWCYYALVCLNFSAGWTLKLDWLMVIFTYQNKSVLLQIYNYQNYQWARMREAFRIKFEML